MNPPIQPNEIQEVQLQDVELKRLNELCLPAEQVSAEQNKDAEKQLAPRYIP